MAIKNKRAYMKKEIEFQAIGKKLPYKAPLDFFEEISNKTLQKAKQREQDHKKNRRLWGLVSVAASLSALFFLGYFMLDPDNKSESNLTVQQLLPAGKQIVHPQKRVAQRTRANEIKRSAQENKTTNTTTTEVVSDVLSDLPDEELSQMAAMFQIDPFISDSAQ